MKKPIYLFSDGKLQRKDNTLLFATEESKKVIPVNTVSEIQVFGEIDLNKRTLEFLTQNKIPVHFFNFYGYYSGTYYPREYLNSGLMIINQARCYLNKSERLLLAKRFVEGAVKNILKNLAYYKKQYSSLGEVSITIQDIFSSLDQKEEIAEIMAVEGEIRKVYYDSFKIILNNEDFHMQKRVKRPPDNPINALISFGNSLIYTTVLSQIYRTHLDPRIGFLHESNQRSFSLNLDIAEIFKPIIVDRVIFSLVNKKQINLKHFEKDLEYSYLNEKGRKIFVQAFEEKLATTIKHKNLGKVSYRRLILLECYKLYKHFLLEDIYTPFVAAW